jgi:hypothetical protein
VRRLVGYLQGSGGVDNLAGRPAGQTPLRQGCEKSCVADFRKADICVCVSVHINVCGSVCIYLYESLKL